MFITVAAIVFMVALGVGMAGLVLILRDTDKARRTPRAEVSEDRSPALFHKGK